MDYGFSWFENEEHILWFMKQYNEKYKGALIISPSKVIVTTTGADNKKEI